MKKDYGFGVVPYTEDKAGGIRFLIIRHQSGHWGFPKGHKEGTETDLESAKREFTEEAGIADFEVQDKDPFMSDTYFSSSPKYGDVNKTVSYYLAKVLNTKTNIQAEEIAEALWCDFHTAHNLLTHDSSKKVLAEAQKRITLS